MMRLFINGLAASAGGGLTYLRNVIPQLAHRTDTRTTVWLSAPLRHEFADLPNISFISAGDDAGALRRFIHEQTALPKLIRSSGAQVLLSAGNFALCNCPVPQILLSRNSLYTSADFLRDVRLRGDYAIWIDTLIKSWLARQSIGLATLTVAPSEAFAVELSQWSGKKVLSLHHGFDPAAFTSDTTSLPHTAQLQLQQARDSFRLLFVSHYNYYRNFEMLIRAIPILSARLNRKVRLFLTCQLKSGANPGAYQTDSAAALANTLRQSGEIVELGAIPYRSLHHLYRACHVYVTPAYAESFAHPLVEAMSMGLPVVASDLPVHREICGGAALYFPRFSPTELAEQILQVQKSPALAEKMSSQGLRRSRDFSWGQHVDRLLSLAQELIESRSRERN